MGKSNSLAKNIGIYTIGNIGSKILSYFIVLIYSYYISTEELGYYDIIHSTISFVSPIVLLEITEGAYRFVLNAKNNDKEKIIVTTGIFSVFTLTISTLVYLLFIHSFSLRYEGWILLLLLIGNLYAVIHELARGLEKNRLYAESGIFYSLLMIGLVLFFLLVLNAGVLSLFASQVIAYALCSVYILLKEPFIVKSFFNIRKNFDFGELKRLLVYSMPLIPDVISWWCINSSDRYLILYFLGESSNGIYSMANKFPTIITSIAGIFYMAWQETAIKEYNSPNRNQYFSKLFDKYSILLITLCNCAIPATRIAFNYFIGDMYSTAWRYTVFLYLSVVFKALCDFLSLGYQISKETSKSMATTITAAIINITVNLIFINYIGLHAASFSTLFAFLILFIIRIIQTRKYFILNINWKKFVFLCVLCLFEGIMMFFINNTWGHLAFCTTSFIVFLYFNMDIIRPFLSKIIRKRWVS